MTPSYRLTKRGERLLDALAYLSLAAFIILGGTIIASYITSGR